MAVLLALISSALWGTSDFLGGTASRRLPVVAVAAWSDAIGLLTAFIACVVVGAFGASDLRATAPWAVAAGLCGFLGLLAYFAALSTGTMGVVAPIAAMGVVVPVIAGVRNGERPGAVQVVGLVIAVVGVVLASGPELSGRAGLRPLALAALAALGFGLALTFIAVGSRTNVTLTLFLMRLAPVAVCAVVGLAMRTSGGARWSDLPILTGIGVGDVSANLFFALASTIGLLSLVSVAGSLYPVATLLLARFVHDERLARVQYVGVAAAMVGVAFIAAGGG